MPFYHDGACVDKCKMQYWELLLSFYDIFLKAADRDCSNIVPSQFQLQTRYGAHRNSLFDKCLVRLVLLITVIVISIVAGYCYIYSGNASPTWGFWPRVEGPPYQRRSPIHVSKIITSLPDIHTLLYLLKLSRRPQSDMGLIPLVVLLFPSSWSG